MTRFTTFIGLALLFLAPVVFPAVPQLINFQGVLRDGSGNPVANGSYSVTFKIYDAPSGGTLLWSESQSVGTTSGLFTVLLGSATVGGIPDVVLSDSSRYLGITVSPDPEMTPRQKLVSVAFGYRVNSVDGASGGMITSKVSIGPGHTNTGLQAFVAGGNNTASGNYATVGGGSDNVAGALYSTVSGGTSDSASGNHSTIGGGSDNIASSEAATVGGGVGNTARSFYSTIGGGFSNGTFGFVATVGGGNANHATGDSSTVAGGSNNQANGINSAVGGGQLNTANGNWSTVSGGGFNKARGQYSIVSGGGGSSPSDSNAALGDHSTVSGGRANIAAGDSSTVGGGTYNDAGGISSTVGGGFFISARGNFSTVGGGALNNAFADFATVAGGASNFAITDHATVSGGLGNSASGFGAAVGGGRGNAASGDSSTIGGGSRNGAGGVNAAVGGGLSNSASNDYAAVGGGVNDSASGFASTVPGGRFNKAAGGYSFAAGYRAKAANLGSFVWADSSADADFASTANNQFLIRAAGGVGIGTNSPDQLLHVKNSGDNGAIVRIGGNSTALATKKIRFGDGDFVAIGEDATQDDRMEIKAATIYMNPTVGVGIGTNSPAAGLHVNGTAGNNTGVWSNLSDRRLKKDIEPIHNALETVEQLQPVTFRWKNEKKDEQFGRVRGLIAQDVEKVIPEWIKTDPDGYKRIEPIGIDALLIEAIKELKAKNEELRNRISALEKSKPQAGTDE